VSGVDGERPDHCSGTGRGLRRRAASATRADAARWAGDARRPQHRPNSRAVSTAPRLIPRRRATADAVPHRRRHQHLTWSMRYPLIGGRHLGRTRPRAGVAHATWVSAVRGVARDGGHDAAPPVSLTVRASPEPPTGHPTYASRSHPANLLTSPSTTSTSVRKRHSLARLRAWAAPERVRPCQDVIHGPGDDPGNSDPLPTVWERAVTLAPPPARRSSHLQATH
jgi:hypothetical protein